jgi:hypothetical protein
MKRLIIFTVMCTTNIISTNTLLLGMGENRIRISTSIPLTCTPMPTTLTFTIGTHTPRTEPLTKHGEHLICRARAHTSASRAGCTTQQMAWTQEHHRGGMLSQEKHLRSVVVRLV